MFNAIIEWLGKDPVFPWFAGDGITFVFCCLILAGCLLVIVNKKIRKLFF